MIVPSVPSIESEDSPQLTATTLPDDPRWQLARRIVASKSFAKSSFLISFLLYVCERELLGKADEISEHQIGVQALGRPVTYNPGEDNIVRNYARLLRKRLEEYFKTEGQDEILRVDIPRGHYVPVFYSTEPAQGAELPSLSPPRTSTTAPADETTFDAPPKPSSLRWPVKRAAAIVLVLSTLMIAGVAAYFGVRYFKKKSTSLSLAFWTQVLSPDRETLIVPADSGFGILQNLTRNSMHLSDYVNGKYLPKIDSVPGLDNRNLNDLSTQRYTSIVDLNIAVSFSRLPESVPGRFAIRYARDLRMDDLKHSNAIIIGSQHSNPWAELFQENMNFVLQYEPEVDDSLILNRRPLAGENTTYKNLWAEDSHRTYAVLAFIPSLDGIGHVILLEGLNMAGTQAAGDFLLNDQTIDPVLLKARLPDGTFRPFELLLETSSIGADSPKARVIAERYGSPARQ
jgi:hypothetical protein